MDLCPDINWHRLVRYVTGEHDPDREKLVQDWILDDERRAKLMDELKQLWNASENSPRSRDLEAAWDRISRQLDRDSVTSSMEGETHRPTYPDDSEKRSSDVSEGRFGRLRRRLRRSGGGRFFLRIGAVGGAIVAAALLAVLVLDGRPFSIDQTRTFSTKPGERSTVHLSDGSKVRLNVDSRLTLPGDFGEGTRVVALTGEAYFEVVRDTTRPFVVRVEGATAEVLGTAFDVQAYADDDEGRVAVAEGAVALRREHAETRDTVLLKAQQLGIISGSHIQTVRTNADIERRLAWTKGQLVFKDAPFREVHRKLERWYDIEIETSIDFRTVDRLNASFDEESVRKAIEAIAAALDFQYRWAERSVILYRPTQQPKTRAG